MAMNVLNVWGEIIGIVGGALILIIFGVTLYPLLTRYRIPSHRMEESSQPVGSSEKQNRKGSPQGDKIQPQDYVESFNGNVHSAFGVIPLVASIFGIGLFIWWAIYLVTNWSQYLWSVRSFWR
jgi:hypothetical protein